MKRLTRNCLLAILGICLVIAGVFIFSDFNGFIKGITGGSPVEIRTYDVEYSVVSTSVEFDVTYENPQGGTEQQDILGTSTWKKSFKMTKGARAYISTQLGSPGTSSIYCQISVDGKIWRKSSSHGEFVIATCSGTIGR